MSIKPIDLQTLFVQMNQVGKDVSAEKNASVLQQSQAGNALVDQTIKEDQSVNKTPPNEEDGIIKDRESGEEGSSENARQEERDKSEKKDKDVYTDPQMGGHVDISG